MFKQWRVERFHLDQCLWYGQFENADKRNWDVGKNDSARYLFMLFCSSFFYFSGNLKLFYKLYNKNRERKSICTRTISKQFNLSIHPTISRRAAAAAKLFSPKYISISIEQFICYVDVVVVVSLIYQWYYKHFLTLGQ